MVTRLDYLVTAMFFIAFIWAFFYGSKWGDLHYTTMNDPAVISEINMMVILGPLILFYELLQIVVLPGKTRLRYLSLRYLVKLFLFIVYKKICDGLQDYHRWRSNP